jgi:hypothetical protein
MGLRLHGQELFGIRGRDWKAYGACRREFWVDKAFDYWRERGFPHYELTPSDVKQEYRVLLEQSVAPLSTSGVAGSTTGLRLANFFQPQMWSVRVSRYLSPHDVFNSDRLLRAAIERSWRIWPDRFGANPATLRRILKTFPGAASVSNFRPTVARAVVTHFSPDRGTIVDFSAGYGGRLLGALSSKRRYIGIEPCLPQVKGLRRLHDSLSQFHANGNAEILKGCAEDLMPLLPRHCADLIFSSPPYFNWEKYSEDSSQSYIRYGTYEEWQKEFLERILVESARILRKSGRLVLNVSGGRRKPDASDVKALCHRLRMRFVRSIPLLITRVPYLHPRDELPHKSEVLLVFKLQ